MALTRLRLFRGDVFGKLVESFSGYTDLAGGAGEQATYSGDPVLVNNGAFKVLPITNLLTGADLLDRTNPAAPTFIEAGTYSIAYSVNGDALTAGGFAVALIQTSAGDANEYGQASHPEESFGTSLVAVVAAGDGLGLYVKNRDGAVARNFGIVNLTLVKL